MRARAPYFEIQLTEIRRLLPDALFSRRSTPSPIRECACAAHRNAIQSFSPRDQSPSRLQFPSPWLPATLLKAGRSFRFPPPGAALRQVKIRDVKLTSKPAKLCGVQVPNDVHYRQLAGFGGNHHDTRNGSTRFGFNENVGVATGMFGAGSYQA